jgi:hypothetical protein
MVVHSFEAGIGPWPRLQEEDSLPVGRCIDELGPDTSELFIS